ncbi:MAG: trypsin-like peptidase domain-containing protein, partial [Dehalococcoidales bacterium]|nr:trypsin-like peptidase domain-containing protein [Dehalococcoidales bacterium]
MKRIKLLIVLSLLIVTLMISSYACNNTLSINDSIVQIWEPIGSTSGEVTLLALGVVVGDGSQILTVLNYEGYNPGRLEVGVPGQQRYQASIQVIDPRTSVTLLKLENTKFTAAAIGEPDNLQPGTDVVIHGWPGSGSGSLESRVTRFPGYATAFMMDIEEEGYISRDGATVTDKKGNVIGLVGTFYDAFVYRLGGQGMTAPIVNIDDALELLSPDAVNQPWAKGPAFSLITTEDTVTGRSPSEPPP